MFASLVYINIDRCVHLAFGVKYSYFTAAVVLETRKRYSY